MFLTIKKDFCKPANCTIETLVKAIQNYVFCKSLRVNLNSRVTSIKFNLTKPINQETEGKYLVEFFKVLYCWNICSTILFLFKETVDSTWMGATCSTVTSFNRHRVKNYRGRLRAWQTLTHVLLHNPTFTLWLKTSSVLENRFNKLN